MRVGYSPLYIYEFFFFLSVGLSIFHRKFLCTKRMYHGHLAVLERAQACPNIRDSCLNILLNISYLSKLIMAKSFWIYILRLS